MASTTITDFVRPWRARRNPGAEPNQVRERRDSRRAIGLWAVALAGFAIYCVFWQRSSGDTLIDFALGVMTFAYSGLLAVFLTALFTKRGNATSVAAALATGFVIILLMQNGIWENICSVLNIEIAFAFGWKMLIATSISFGVCCLGKREAGAA